MGFDPVICLSRRILGSLFVRCRMREGGYCRVIRCGFRTGDRAPMAIIEYVDREGEVRPARPARPAEHSKRLQPNLRGRSAAGAEAAIAAAQAAAAKAGSEAAEAPLR
jgi:large subunit ribosomal protein L17